MTEFGPKDCDIPTRPALIEAAANRVVAGDYTAWKAAKWIYPEYFRDGNRVDENRVRYLAKRIRDFIRSIQV